MDGPGPTVVISKGEEMIKQKIILSLLAVCVMSSIVFASTQATRQYNWVDDRNNSIPITASRMDTEFDNIITKLNQKVIIRSTSPSSPIAGMLWYDSTNKFLKQYRNNEWVVVAIHVGASAAATPQEGDAWYETDTDIFKVYNGSAWLNLLMLSSLTTGSFVISDSTSTATELALTTSGAIFIGDGAGVPTVASAFTSSTGQLKHEFGGIEADISAIAKAGIIAGTGTGTMGILAAGTDGYFLKRDAAEATGLKWVELAIGSSGCLLVTASQAAPAVWTTEVYDIAGNCTTTTFTAPATGHYLLTYFSTPSATTGDPDCAASIVTSNRTYTQTTGVESGTSEPESLSISVVADMDSTDTATVTQNTSNCTYTEEVFSVYRLK